MLFIAVDDLRDTVGHLRNFSGIETPHIDQLARSGMVFENAHCAAPACSPSRTALLSGWSPARTGFYENGQLWAGELEYAESLPRRFMKHGWYTVGSGKVFHGTGALPNFHSEFQVPYDKDYGEYGEPVGKPLDIAVEEMPDAQRVDYIVRQIEEVRDTPVFLACGLVKPHLPFNVPRDYFERFPLEKIQLPPMDPEGIGHLPPIARFIARGDGELVGRLYHEHVIAHDLWKRNIQAYLACVAFVDDQIGRLLAAWDASPHGRDGIVVLWGDNGWHFGEKEHWSKFTLWRECTRVPLIIRAPGVTRAGSRTASAVSLLDLYPTLLDLCGLPPRDDLDGLTLRPLLQSPDITWDRPAVIHHGYRNAAATTDRWHYIHYRDESKELYDLHADPHQHHNLAGDPEYRKVVNRMHAYLPRHYAENQPFGRRADGAQRHSFMEAFD
ncbi:MAG: sulfatase [Oceanipulchritudo sp.]